MLYLDTSVLVTALTNEPRSSAVYDWLGQLDGQIAVSGWVLTEFASALSIKIRTKDLSPADGRATRAKYDALAERSFRNILVVADDFERASNFAGDYRLNLRGGDALHLAIVERHRATLCTLEKGQADAGHALNIATQLI